VDTLLANQFHLENNCAILGVEGYPAASFEIVRRMLKNNPRLLVLAVHDASVKGCSLAYTLGNSPEWFPGKKIVDVGLRPEHARHFEGLLRDAELVPSPHHLKCMTESEYKWLSRWRLEATAIPPEQLIKRLYRAIVEQESGGGGDSGGSIDSGAVIVMPTDTTDGGGDSFG
jgi:hypothetical protein